jgi:class 3 adenylate cyclase
MSVFQTVSNAFDFAVSLQRSLLDDPISVVPGDIPQERSNQSASLSLRLAIHVGPALLIQTSYGDDVFGAAVNLAARLTACAVPGEVVVSTPARLALSSEQRLLLHPSERLALKSLGSQIDFSRLPVADLRR